MASITRRRRRNKIEWYIKTIDTTTGETRWISCRKRNANNETQRKALLKEIQKGEDRYHRQVEELGDKRPRYGTPVSELIDLFIKELDARLAVRQARGGRAGIAVKTYREYTKALRVFRSFTEGMRTGDLDGDRIRQFKLYVQTNGDGGTRVRSPRTVNKYTEVIRNFLYRYGDANPPYFIDVPERLFRRALRALPVERSVPIVLDPTQLQSLLRQAWGRDQVKCTITRQSKAAGKGYVGEFPSKFQPIFPITAMLMLTGARTHELLRLRWSDVDLESGTLVLRSGKTGRQRILRLVGDPAGDVSPGLLQLLIRWRSKSEKRVAFVLPHALSVAPSFPKKAWNQIRKSSGVENATAKSLRSSWVSYLCSMGRPPMLVAWFAGHSPAVLEKHYADYARMRLEGDNLDEVMGLTSLLGQALQ